MAYRTRTIAIERSIGGWSSYNSCFFAEIPRTTKRHLSLFISTGKGAVVARETGQALTFRFKSLLEGVGPSRTLRRTL